YFTTGSYRERPAQPWVPGTPNDYGKWLFVGANSDAVMDMRDRVTLTAIAARRRADPAADVGDLVPLLGPQGHTVYSLLANHDPDRTVDLIAALPQHLRDNFAALDLKNRDVAGPPPHVSPAHPRAAPRPRPSRPDAAASTWSTTSRTQTWSRVTGATSSSCGWRRTAFSNCATAPRNGRQ